MHNGFRIEIKETYAQQVIQKRRYFMKKRTRTRKNVVSMSLVMLMLATGMLTACSNGKTEETTAVEGAEQVEEPAQDNAAITETETEQETEDTADSEDVGEGEAEESQAAEETETQAVVYEGIDMDSTLPGIEWIETFNGIINEPKLVIFNDDTNKKVILENGQKTDISKSDTMIIYIPREKENTIMDFDGITFNLMDGVSNTLRFREIGGRVGEEVVTENVIRYDGVDYTLTATLVITE